MFTPNFFNIELYGTATLLLLLLLFGTAKKKHVWVSWMVSINNKCEWMRVSYHLHGNNIQSTEEQSDNGLEENKNDDSPWAINFTSLDSRRDENEMMFERQMGYNTMRYNKITMKSKTKNVFLFHINIYQTNNKCERQSTFSKFSYCTVRYTSWIP